MDSEVRETLKKAEKSLQGLLALPDKSGVDLQTKVHALSTWITHLQTVVETLQKAGTESERLEATTKKSMQETVQPIADDQRFIKEWTEAIDKELPKLQRLEDLSTQKSFDTLGEKMKELKTVLDTLGENTKEFSTQKSIDTLHDQAKELKKALENKSSETSRGKERSLRDVAQTRAAQAESDKQSAVETAENKVSTLQSRLGPLEQFKQKAIEHAAAADAAAHERRQRIQQLEQEANGLQTRNGELTSTLTERETEIAKLRSIIGQATTERLTTNEELSRLQGVEISLRQEVSAHEGTISERNEQVKDLKTDKTNLVKYATELKSDKDTLTQANIKLETDKDKLKGEVAGLKQQLTKSEGFAAQFKADKDRLEGDIKELKQQRVSSDPEQLATDWTKASSKVSERLASFSIFDDGRHDNADEIVESLAFIAGDDEKWARFAQFVELAKHNEAYCVYQMIDDNDCQQPDLLVRGVHKCTYHSAHGGYCYRAKCVMRNDVKEFIIGKKRPALRV
ncbi:hypothetical protein COL26b_008077 [Colletotrichum chrysophilum]|uniref:uncharacterized protein n=1 Tax=Colletotrichum chrysophilum TaxID=1836956 RepID=UPI0023019AD5|nr:uncharacterized protein COL26b_008077 [Colletotrichum chrysophilum]KAJ0373738.1 hypothetical protein COL26b_008077 [Colletotrichum chrysophilum]